MYHTRTWWYEIADLVRKLVLTGLITFIQKGSSTQVAFGVVVCFMVLFVSLDISPMFDTNVNRIANIALLELFATLFLGLLLKVDTVNEEAAASSLFTALVMALSCFIIVYPAVAFLVERRHKRKSVTSTKGLDKLTTLASSNARRQNQAANGFRGFNKAILAPLRKKKAVVPDDLDAKAPAPPDDERSGHATRLSGEVPTEIAVHPSG
uniref:TRP C-terminal domain-containing protein n=1 Tax=Pyramimonas obovata TaxID=1411642 RepID=A0A7S0MRJ9_9CHLO|mmetsp:Transcript_11734/g.24595  ORF Transcript_11734/g.24595 Transcript_11734/m.24595 type:complete len:209 (+) Transcript_11734:1512-2138(+)